MSLRKTTILPTDSGPLAVKLFKQWVYDEAAVLFVAQGASAEIERMVARADKLAGIPTDPRWVIWARKPELIQLAIDALTGKPALKKAIPGARGFSISIGDEVRDVVKVDEPEPDMARLFTAFVRAEASRVD